MSSGLSISSAQASRLGPFPPSDLSIVIPASFITVCCMLTRYVSTFLGRQARSRRSYGTTPLSLPLPAKHTDQRL